jgi:hypothetical protein
MNDAMLCVGGANDGKTVPWRGPDMQMIVEGPRVPFEEQVEFGRVPAMVPVKTEWYRAVRLRDGVGVEEREYVVYVHEGVKRVIRALLEGYRVVEEEQMKRVCGEAGKWFGETVRLGRRVRELEAHNAELEALLQSQGVLLAKSAVHVEEVQERNKELEATLKHLSAISDEKSCGRYVEAFRVHYAAKEALKGGAK